MPVRADDFEAPVPYGAAEGAVVDFFAGGAASMATAFHTNHGMSVAWTSELVDARRKVNEARFTTPSTMATCWTTSGTARAATAWRLSPPRSRVRPTRREASAPEPPTTTEDAW